MHSILRFQSLRLPVLAGIWALVVGCGGAAPQAATPSLSTAQAAAPTATAAPESAPPASWSADMTKEQKIAFMKKNVVPAMRPVFQAQNGARYADFGCKTCHGPEFKDPKDFLPRLTMKDGNITAFAQKPEVAKFMAASVVPKMASAMGLAPFDMKTHQGFGCGGCHSVDMK